MDREPDVVAVADVKVGMRRKESLRFRVRRTGKTIDIMMAVAFGMGNADQRAERQILLHAETGLTGEILAGDEKFFAARAPFCRAHRIEDRLVDTLAGLRGNAAIAKRSGGRERVIGVVGLVNDKIAPGQCAQWRLPENLTWHRLFDIQQLCRNRIEG